MDFFNAQEKAHRSTTQLIILFSCAVVCLIFGLHFLISLIWVWTDPVGRWFDGGVFALTAVGTILVVGAGMLYKINQLKGGGAAVCMMMGAEPVPLTAHERPMRRLRNIVEEMAIAAGVPVPSLFVLEGEKGINAFAAGFAPSDAAICVTRGCLEQFNRDELQGVIAHEFSHVLNGDMRLNIRLMGVLHGILCLSLAGFVLLRTGHYGGGRRGGGFGLLVLGLGLVILGSVGALFARLIKAAVSRQREFLADASAVQFTRNPDGISSALKKIGGFARHGHIDTAAARAASHMFFANAMRGGGIKDWFATHPPIEHRIAAIDPYFAKYPTAGTVRTTHPNEAVAGFAGAGFAGAGYEGTVSADRTVESIGQLTPEAVAYGRKVLEDLPRDIAAAVHEPFSARAVIYCLLLDKDGDVRREQFRRLNEHADPATVQETLHLSSTVRGLERHLRLPIIDLAMPALRTMSLSQAKTFRENIEQLIDADNRISLFEFTVDKILDRHLDSAFVGPQTLPVRHHTVAEVAGDCTRILSVLAHVGHDDREAVEKAFADGRDHLGIPSLELLPFLECKRPELEVALDRLAHANLSVKKKVLSGAAHAVASDGEMTAVEAELLRAVADALGCPMPPVPLASPVPVS